MKLGVVQHVFRGLTTDLDRFKRTRAFGLDGIEPDLTLADLADPGEARLSSLKASRDATGVPIPSLCMGEHNNQGFVFATWRGQAAVDEVHKAVRWCKALDARVLLVPFFFANEPRNEAQRRRMAETFRPICREAEQLGVTVCFEGLLTATQIWQVTSIVDSPAFGVYFDMGNAVWIDLDPAAEIRALGSLVKQVHIKDTQVVCGDSRVGSGRVRLAEVARALHDIRYDQWLFIEAFGLGDEAIESDIAASRRAFGLR
jgi:sugar phosphate isomerase/epimerase